jgi:hypothetical protein
LPDRDRIVALVCHWRLSKPMAIASPVLAIPHCCVEAVNITAPICRLSAAGKPSAPAETVS